MDICKQQQVSKHSTDHCVDRMLQLCQNGRCRCSPSAHLYWCQCYHNSAQTSRHVCMSSTAQHCHSHAVQLKHPSTDMFHLKYRKVSKQQWNYDKQTKQMQQLKLDSTVSYKKKPCLHCRWGCFQVSAGPGPAVVHALAMRITVVFQPNIPSGSGRPASWL